MLDIVTTLCDDAGNRGEALVGVGILPRSPGPFYYLKKPVDNLIFTPHNGV